MRSRETFIAAAIAIVASVATLGLAPVLPDAVAVIVAVAASVLAVGIGRRFLKRGRVDRASISLANISHEIRTPLNGILGLTQLLMRMRPTIQQREYLEAIKSSGQSLLRLINDILDYSKMRSGALRFEHDSFPLRKSVRDTVRGLASQAHLSGLELAFWVKPDVPEDLVGDPSRLGQVLTNLLVNAIKYTQIGEVALAVSLESLDDVAALVRFSVSDTGVGVPEGQRGTIFDAFAQGSQTRSATIDEGGVGLGLAIAKDLVERMGGEIGIEASASGGSTFYFTARFELPAGGAIGDDTAPTDPLPGFAVLIIDDSPAQRTALEKQMKAWGFLVTTAYDEASSLEAMERDGPFSFLLVDSHIPGVDVWALAAELQKRHPTPGLLMTLAHEHVDTEVLRAHGFHGHLTKPLAPTHLIRAIEIIRRGASVDTPEDVQTHNMDRLALGGIRVLLAEDHPVNRTVVVSMLKRIGCHVIAVTNGQEALERLKPERFDLALVDVQMPEVAGLELARAIRAREAVTGDHLPLIAVTAHAHEADRDRCRHAGMEAFLSKPFEEEELVSLMRQCLAEPNRSVSVPRFDRASALVRANGDVALLAELSTLFLEETPQTFGAIEAALAACDDVAVERLAHRLKGALLTLSAERAAKIALTLERMARTSSPAECEAVLGQLATELEHLTPELEALAASVESR